MKIKFQNTFFTYFIVFQGSTCPLNEYTHFKMAKVSAKGKHDWAFCSDSSHLCLSGWNSTDLAKKVLCLTVGGVSNILLPLHMDYTLMIRSKK